MKLYTEIQMLEAIDRAIFSTDINSFDILEDLTPIELPSDEEIYDECQIGGMDTNQQLCFQLGAKWMRNKIQGGNNEQQ